MWIRTEGRLFGIVFVLFNVLLAIFNVLNYRVSPRATVPCVVIVAPTPPTPVVQPQVTAAPLKLVVTSPVPPSPVWTDLPSYEGITENTTPHTKRIFPKNITDSTESTFATNASSVWEIEERDKYTVVKRYIPAEGPDPPYNSSVTLCTQGTFEFLQHVPELCQRWDGPLSVSVYAPGTDLPVAVRKILYLRTCGAPCVRSNVTWHLVYETALGPSGAELETPYYTAEMEDYGTLQCELGTKPLSLVSEIRNSNKLPYPINVARNVARQLARTHYVLASDIELYPSLHIVPRFMNLVSRLAKKNEGKPMNLRVFTLPIFEVKKEFPAPKTKEELVKRIKDGQAIFFHKWVCDACQNFPKRDQWLKFLPTEAEDSLGVFEVTKRQFPRTAWEPIYIGTNNEPLYDERLTWEGKRDKMSQMFELCLLDYDFYILDNAFLCHAPGIKTLSSLDQKRRAPFMYKNNAVHNKLLSQMKKKYGPRKGC